MIKRTIQIKHELIAFSRRLVVISCHVKLSMKYLSLSASIWNLVHVLSLSNASQTCRSVIIGHSLLLAKTEIRNPKIVIAILAGRFVFVEVPLFIWRLSVSWFEKLTLTRCRFVLTEQRVLCRCFSVCPALACFQVSKNEFFSPGWLAFFRHCEILYTIHLRNLVGIDVKLVKLFSIFYYRDINM